MLPPLLSCGAGETEPFEFDCRNVISATSPQCLAGTADSDCTCQSIHVGLGKTQGLHGPGNGTLFNEVGSVSRHACHDHVSRMNMPGIPESRDVEPFLRGSNHFFDIR